MPRDASGARWNDDLLPGLAPAPAQMPTEEDLSPPPRAPGYRGIGDAQRGHRVGQRPRDRSARGPGRQRDHRDADASRTPERANPAVHPAQQYSPLTPQTGFNAAQDVRNGHMNGPPGGGGFLRDVGMEMPGSGGQGGLDSMRSSLRQMKGERVERRPSANLDAPGVLLTMVLDEPPCIASLLCLLKNEKDKTKKKS